MEYVGLQVKELILARWTYCQTKNPIPHNSGQGFNSGFYI